MTTAEPNISVVVVNYNGGPLLLRCLEALQASRPTPEVILCDNASQDGSLAAARRAFPEMKILAFERNLGFAMAVNRGLAAARGRWLVVLNPDCLVEPDTLATLSRVMAEHPRAGLAGCRILDPDGREQRGSRRHLPRLGSGLAKALGRRGIDLHQMPLPAAPQPVEAISGACMMVRRAALDEVGGLDEDYFLHCEDLDWCKRFHDAGWEVLFVPQASVVHHQGTCSAERPRRVAWHKHRGMWRYYRKHLAGDHPRPLRALVWSGIHLRLLIQWLRGRA